ncbi:MAG: M3 family metallopeptidase [Cyanobacteriota bacterium]
MSLSPSPAASSSTPVLPLLVGEGLPSFDAISADQVGEAIPRLLDELNARFEALEADLQQRLERDEPLPWEAVIDPLQRLEERLRWSWGVVSHLNAVTNTPAWREAPQAQQAEVVRFGNRSGQSRLLFQALGQLERQHLAAGEGDPLRLDATQLRILEAEQRAMTLRGVALEGPDQDAFNAASEELAQLATRFSNNVLDATNGWTLLLRDPGDVDGLPESLRTLLAQAARDAGDTGEDGRDATAEPGPWRLGLDMPRFVPFLRYSRRRDLREQVYRAHVSRASQGELNNGPLLERILTLKHEQARRLGFRHWADLSLASKMADSVEAVEKLLEELRAAAHPIAQAELDTLRRFAEAEEGSAAADLQPWDVSVWADRLRQRDFDLDSEALRPWFPLEQVLDGLFSLCNRLFGIRIEAADADAPRWHPDVRYFRVHAEGHDQPIAAFYLDPFSRPGSKRGGAWMDECLTRSRRPDGTPVLPVAYLVCNQSPPVGDTPSLMTFEEVETLFHEFGHGLQHMLTTIDRPQAAGINNVEWDAVELPSQFMENWCYDRKTLMGMARHWQSGEPLPEADYRKLLATRTFLAASATLRQVHLALTDLRLHSRWTPGGDQSPEDIRREVARTTTVLEPIPEDALLCSFSHIFAGGYSAGYYSYKWAEVLSADAFSAFEEAGLEQDEEIQAIGRRFRDTVLSLGGSRPPAEVFAAFRGREPSTAALIRHSGLAVA